MALAAASIVVIAAFGLCSSDAGFEMTASHLTVSARIPGADNAKFQEIANKASTGCPVSKLLNAKITMGTTLEA